MKNTIAPDFEPCLNTSRILRLAFAMLLACAVVSQAQLHVSGNRLITTLPMPFVTLDPEMSFGSSLAVGDFDGNGIDDLAIGIPNKAVNAVPQAGQVAVLYSAGAQGTASGVFQEQVWHQAVTGVDGTPEEGDRFGGRLATGDFNGDGYDDLAIAVVGEDVGLRFDAGIVHLIYGSNVGLQGATEHAIDRTIAPGDVQSQGFFGWALASGDFDSDGYDDLAIGSPGERVDGISGAGVAVVAYGTPSGLDTANPAQRWTQRQLGAINGIDDSEQGDRFGSALVAGDFDGDFYDDLAVGAPFESIPVVPGSDEGAVNVIFGDSPGLRNPGNQFLTIPLPIAQSFTRFGIALAAGDLNADGVTDLVVGAPTYNIGSILDAGAVFLHFGDLGTGVETTGTRLIQANAGSSTETDDQFGADLTIGDFDADGYDDVAIGAWAESVSGQDRTGAVSVFHGEPDDATGHTIRTPGFTWHQTVSGVVDDTELDDFFGAALAAGNFDGGGDDLAIGVPGEDLFGFADTGAVHLIRSRQKLIDGFESGDLSQWDQVVQ